MRGRSGAGHSRGGVNDGDIQHAHAQVQDTEDGAQGTLMAGGAGGSAGVEKLPSVRGPVGSGGVPGGMAKRGEVGFAGGCHATALEDPAVNVDAAALMRLCTAAEDEHASSARPA
jgi:hypothetical protein